MGLGNAPPASNMAILGIQVEFRGCDKMEIVVPNHFANLRVSSELFHLLDDARHVLHVFSSLTT